MRVPNRAQTRRSPRVDVRNYYAWHVGHPAALALLWPSRLSEDGVQASAVGPAPTWSYTGNQYNDSGVSVGTVPALHGSRGVWCGPGYTNLFSDSVAEQTKTLTAQNYTVWCDTGSVVCGAYGTATAETPLTFTATAGSCTFTPTGVTRWMLTSTVAPMPYVPPGTTVASAAGTSGGNGIGFELVPGLKECFEKTPGPATCTVAAEVTMGVGSGETTAARDVLSWKNSVYDLWYEANNRVARTSDGTTSISPASVAWSRNEQHLKIVQTNALGTQFRVGNLRRGIDSAIQWGSWVNYDGSLNPLAHLRLAFDSTVPIWIKGVQVWNKGQVSESEILRQFKPVIKYVPTTMGQIPDNAIYAGGLPIPDPSGGGYLTYGVST